MFRIAICDDNSNFISQVKEMLMHWEQTTDEFHLSTFDNGDSLINAHLEAPFDIILLDVLMPFTSGIHVAKELRNNDKSVKIVFLTSSPEYAIDSYSVKASNYLLKPLDEGKLYRCLEELFEEIAKDTQSIYIKTLHAIHKTPLKTIEYLETQNKHVLFRLTNQQTIESMEPLYEYETKLSMEEGFFKCHRSYMVNMEHIVTYTAKEIKMHSGYRIPIARNRHNEFKEAYFSYIFRKAGE